LSRNALPFSPAVGLFADYRGLFADYRGLFADYRGLFPEKSSTSLKLRQILGKLFQFPWSRGFEGNRNRNRDRNRPLNLKGLHKISPPISIAISISLIREATAYNPKTKKARS